MEAILEIKNFDFNYGNKKILDDISFSVSCGEIVGLLGENGAGKTTLIDSIYGFHGDMRSIKVFSNTSSINNPILKKKISYVQDTPNLLDYLTAKQYLNFICYIEQENKSKKSEEIDELISQFHLKDSYSSKLLKDYSFGMKKKIQLISEIILHKEFLMIDEPTNGLDISMIILLKELIRKENNINKTTILISSHNTKFLQDICHRVLIFDDKKIVKDMILSEGVDLETEFLKIKNIG